jgi:hypothetical protein
MHQHRQAAAAAAKNILYNMPNSDVLLDTNSVLDECKQATLPALLAGLVHSQAVETHSVL